MAMAIRMEGLSNKSRGGYGKYEIEGVRVWIWMYGIGRWKHSLTIGYLNEAFY
jgi:hypothetical protein